MKLQRGVGILIFLLVILACTFTNMPIGNTHQSSETPTPEQHVNVSVKSWAMTEETQYGFAGVPGETMFIVEIEPVRIDEHGGELLVHMTPANDQSCGQNFVISWEFDVDVTIVNEGDTISLELSNLPQGSSSSGLLDCYSQAKSSMAYGGEVVTAFYVSGVSHFLNQPKYKEYQRGNSQYLFVPVDNPGTVYPVDPGFVTPIGSDLFSFYVRDAGAAQLVGEADAPHGNFTIRVSAGSVFVYDVTYLYEAIAD